MNPPVILLIPHSPACPEFAGVNILVPPPGLSADSPLLPSGLLGPVRLLSIAATQ